MIDPNSITSEMAHATARLITGPLTGAVKGILRVGEVRMHALRVAAQTEELPDEVRTEVKGALNDVAEDMIALQILHDALTIGSPDDVRKAQDKVREMMAKHPDEAHEKLTPHEMQPIVALVVALRHAADMAERILRLPFCECSLQLAEQMPAERIDAEMLQQLRAEHDKAQEEDAAWHAAALATMDDVAITSLLREVGLHREANPDDDEATA